MPKKRTNPNGPLWLIKIVNFVSYYLCHLFLLIIVRPKISLEKEKLKESVGNGGLIMICNHQSIFDPWIICASLPPSIFFKIMPVRIMGALEFSDPLANSLNKLGIVKIIYYLYGVIGFCRDWSLEEKLAPFAECLKKKGTVLIFPEGRLNPQSTEVNKFKKGAAYLHKETEGEILPFSIKKDKNKKICINIGLPIKIPEEILASENPEDPYLSNSSEYLRKAVDNLYNKIV